MSFLQAAQVERCPISFVDLRLLALRWVLIAGTGVLALVEATAPGMWLPLPIALALCAVVNLLLSAHMLRRHAFGTGRATPILIADGAQAGLSTLVMGAYHSIFFPLLVLLVVELAVALSLRQAAGWTFATGAFYLAAATINQMGDWSILAVIITDAKLIILLVVSALSVVSMDQVRRADSLRRAAEQHAEQLARLNQQVLHVNRQLEQLSRARQSFVSAIAHELRTPLTVLKTLMPTLVTPGQMAEQQRQEVAAIAQQNLSRLESLISDFLDSAQLEAGAVVLYRRPLDLERRVRHTVDTMRPLFADKEQVVVQDLPSSLTQVYADRRRVDQIYSSLLHNACKFAPTGGVIRISASQAGEMVHSCVEDSGPGVTRAERSNLFRKFHSAPVEQGSAGVGLGLYICHELVALHGGRIWYEDRPGGGSRFCFSLPAATETQRNGADNEEDPGN